MRFVLALLALALAAVLAIQWRDWPPPPPVRDASGTTPGEPPPAEDRLFDRLRPLQDKQEYVVVSERPLFLPDRRPPAEQPPEEEPAPVQDATLDQIDLNAVVITPQETLAWVNDPAKPGLVRLRLGDDLQGWSVREVLSDRLVLERQGETNTLVLRDYSNMPRAAPPRPTPAARIPPPQAHRPEREPPKPPERAKPQPRPGSAVPPPPRPSPAAVRGPRPPAAAQPPNAPANPAARNQRTRGHAEPNQAK